MEYTQNNKDNINALNFTSAKELSTGSAFRRSCRGTGRLPGLRSTCGWAIIKLLSMHSGLCLLVFLKQKEETLTRKTENIRFTSNFTVMMYLLCWMTHLSFQCVTVLCFLYLAMILRLSHFLSALFMCSKSSSSGFRNPQFNYSPWAHKIYQQLGKDYFQSESVET